MLNRYFRYLREHDPYSVEELVEGLSISSQGSQLKILGQSVRLT